MTEPELIRAILVAASRCGARLFRNNTGLGWTGSRIRRNPDGSITIFDPRPLRAGLCEGSSDLIGWSPTGQFMATEAKYGSTSTTKPQHNFIRAVNASGGIGIIARSVEDVVAALTTKNPPA